ncbi:MAG TPA: hypothetical protein VI300_17610 [Solirubrobacter sp.]
MTTSKQVTGERHPARLTHAERAPARHDRPDRAHKAHAVQVYAARPRPSVAAPGVSSAVAQLPLPVRLGAASAGTVVATVTPIHIPVAEAAASHPGRRNGVRQRFGELRAALAEGWEIVQPIFARPLWSVSDDSTTAFNFVLRRDDDTRLVTVPEGRTVARFIRDRQLTVDYRH